jgi:hypothetical protein
MDLEDAGSKASYLIRDRDCKFAALFDSVLADTVIKVVLSGVETPRTNSIMERWVRTGRRRTAGPHSDLEPATAAARPCTNSNPSTPATGLTRASPTPDRCAHYPRRSLTHTR